MDSKKLMRILTVSAIVFITLLAIALIINIVKLSNVNRRKAELTDELAQIERRINEINSESERISSDAYVDRYAREYLNMQGKDEQAFTGKEK